MQSSEKSGVLRKGVLCTAICVIIFASLAYDNFYSVGMVAGEYSFDFAGVAAEEPRQGDRLTLKPDGQFASDTWGTGRFRLNGSRITLEYVYEYGKASNSYTIYRPFFWGRPRIKVNADLDHYFGRVD